MPIESYVESLCQVANF